MWRFFLVFSFVFLVFPVFPIFPSNSGAAGSCQPNSPRVNFSKKIGKTRKTRKTNAKTRKNLHITSTKQEKIGKNRDSDTDTETDRQADTNGLSPFAGFLFFSYLFEVMWRFFLVFSFTFLVFPVFPIFPSKFWCRRILPAKTHEKTRSSLHMTAKI